VNLSMPGACRRHGPAHGNTAYRTSSRTAVQHFIPTDPVRSLLFLILSQLSTPCPSPGARNQYSLAQLYSLAGTARTPYTRIPPGRWRTHQLYPATQCVRHHARRKPRSTHTYGVLRKQEQQIVERSLTQSVQSVSCMRLHLHTKYAHQQAKLISRLSISLIALIAAQTAHQHLLPNTASVSMHQIMNSRLSQLLLARCKAILIRRLVHLQIQSGILASSSAQRSHLWARRIPRVCLSHLVLVTSGKSLWPLRK